jgi:hypothetical protein
MNLPHPTTGSRLLFLVALCVLISPTTWAQEVFTEPFPAPSSNAALHYNSAMLSLSMMDPAGREVLAKPVWEEVRSLSQQELQAKLSDLIHDGRHAINTALFGSRQNQADFGIDYSLQGLGAMPHINPMLQLGRLMTLAGLHAQSNGQWKDAAKRFFGGLRMGRHMVQQPTLIESLTGVEILENNYYALANWAARCPDRKLVQYAFLHFEIMVPDMVNPAQSLAHEASIIDERCERLKAAFPDGSWAEMLLESLGEFVAAQDEQELEKKAIELCVKRGIPAAAFNEKATFDSHVDRVKALWVQCMDETSSTMMLPPVARVARCNQIFEAYRDKLKRLGDEGFPNPSEIGNFFAIHEAEMTMLRVALAVAAERTDAGFPASLENVAQRFGGKLPRSPYDGSALVYQTINNGKDFSLGIAEAKAGEVTLPKIDFSTAGR